MGCRQIGRIGVVESESGTRHLISENLVDYVSVRDHLGEGSMCARNIRHTRYTVTTNLDPHMVRMMRQSLEDSSSSSRSEGVTASFIGGAKDVGVITITGNTVS